MKRLSEKGFSLIEIIVVAGLMGLVALGAAEIQRVGLGGQKMLLAQDDSRVLTDDMDNLLADPTACLNTFGGKNPVNGDFVTSIMDKSAPPAARYTVGGTYGNRTIILNPLSATFHGIGVGQISGPGAIDKRAKVPQWDVTGAGTGVALVSIDWLQTTAAAKVAGSPQQQHLYRFFLIQATVDASNRITACNSIQGYRTTASTGSGAGNFLAMWTSSTALGNSVVAQNGSNVGIGTQTPGVTLDVQGGVRPGDTATVTACGMGKANGEGTQRYNYATHQMEYCNGTTWTSGATVDSFGGAYFYDVGGATEPHCYTPNPRTGDCTCPAGYSGLYISAYNNGDQFQGVVCSR